MSDEEKPSAKVLHFNGVTKLDLPPDRILEGAVGKLDGVVVMGFTKEGEQVYFASSYADGGTVMWLMEQCKFRMLIGAVE